MSAFPRRRALVTGFVIITLAGASGYGLRSRVARWTKSAPGSAIDTSRAPAPTDTPRTDTSTARGEVTIDPQRQQFIGVRTVPVTRASVAPAIRAVGQVRYDETRLSDINLKVEGWIRDLYVDYTGQPVRRGQPLFTLYSPEMLTTEREFLLALNTREQLQQSQIADARNHAEQIVDAARERLRLWDLSDEQIQALEQARQVQATVTFRSPSNGFVIDKQAVQGLHVMPGQTLYKLADVSVVWVEADVYENDIRHVRVGARGTMTVDAYPNERFTGPAVYIGSGMDEKTRTVKVRFELVNRAERLKPGMYAQVELTGTAATGLVVPTNAVLDSGREQVVFVAEGDGHFAPRHVTVGRRLQDTIEIVEGVKAGEHVATGATFFLDSESQLRASLQGYVAPPANAAGAVPREQLTIAFRTQPDPPKTGDTVFEATVRDRAGTPIVDADVSVQLFMAAMPTMNMPAMRNEVKLPSIGGGIYRGPGEMMMAGRWDATVVVSKAGQRLGSKTLTLVAR